MNGDEALVRAALISILDYQIEAIKAKGIELYHNMPMSGELITNKTIKIVITIYRPLRR